MVRSEPHGGLPRRLYNISLRRRIHTHEAHLRAQHLDRGDRGQYPTSDGLGCCRRAERRRQRGMAGTAARRGKCWGMASRSASLCVAIPSLQRAELDDPRGVQERGIPHAGVDKHEDERPRGVAVLAAFHSDLLRPHVVRSDGQRVSRDEQRGERVDGEGGVEVLEEAGAEGQRARLVLGECLASACRDGVGDGA